MTHEEQFIDRIMTDNSKLRCENHRLRIMLKALIDPEQYGHQVQPEARQKIAALLENENGR